MRKMLDNKQIVFTTDIFRIANNIEYYLDEYLFSIYKMFSEQIKLATRKQPILSLSRDNTYFDVQKFYNLCNYEYSEENWLKISSGEISKEAEEYFAKSFKDYFLIIYHANPYMIKMLNKYNIDYIDIFEGSVRFLEDLHLVMRSNNTEIYKKLLKYQYDENFIKLEASRLSAAYKYYGINLYSLKKNSLLICGQTHSDISLLQQGRYVGLQDFESKIADIMKNYDYLYFKPHPYNRDNEKNIELLKKIGDVEIVSYNFYGLMASDQIRGVAALSSGVLKESSYFNKNVHVLSHLYVDYHISDEIIDTNKFVILSTDYYSPTFWHDVLSPVYEVNECKYFNFNCKTNWLRNNVFSWWGYEIGNWHHKPQKIQFRKLPDIITEQIEPNKSKEVISDDISVIVQGAIDRTTKECLKSIRKYLPKAEIILSTWEGSDTEGLDYDKLVLSRDPGGVSLLSTDKINNINRQIVSTKNGLEKSSRKYSLKLRTDCKISGLGFLKQFNILRKGFLKREKFYHYFQERIIIDSIFTRNSKNHNIKEMGLCFHPSDLWFFGLTEDLKSLFDIPLQEKFISNINGVNYLYRVPEQYIWISFLTKKALNLSIMDSMYYNNAYTRELSNRTILNNFFVLDHNKSGITLPKKLTEVPHVKFVLSTKDYFDLYGSLYSNDYIHQMKQTQCLPYTYLILKDKNKLYHHYKSFFQPIEKTLSKTGRWIMELFRIIGYIAKIACKSIYYVFTKKY